MATVLEVVQTISQIVAHRGYDGAKDDKGEPVKIGLKREEGNPLLDKRIMDGFGVKFHGDQLIVTYHSEILLSDIYGTKLEEDVDQKIQEVVNFLKKEYKGITRGIVTGKQIGRAHV